MKQCFIEFPYFSSILLLRHMTVHSTLLLTSQDHRHQSLDHHFHFSEPLLHPSSSRFFAIQFAQVSIFITASWSSFFFRFRFFFVFRRRYGSVVDFVSASHIVQIELVVTEQFFVSPPLAFLLAILFILFPIEFAFIPALILFILSEHSLVELFPDWFFLGYRVLIILWEV